MTMRLCEIEGCEQPHLAKGFCRRHYQTDYYARNPDKLDDKRKRDRERRRAPDFDNDPVQRLLKNVELDGECWVWTGSVTSSGYGQFHLQGEQGAHRASYISFIGPIPDGHVVHHTCRRKLCINPEHLEAVTQSHNVREGAKTAAKIRQQQIERHRRHL